MRATAAHARRYNNLILAFCSVQTDVNMFGYTCIFQKYRSYVDMCVRTYTFINRIFQRTNLYTDICIRIFVWVYLYTHICMRLFVLVKIRFISTSVFTLMLWFCLFVFVRILCVIFDVYFRFHIFCVCLWPDLSFCLSIHMCVGIDISLLFVFMYMCKCIYSHAHINI